MALMVWGLGFQPCIGVGLSGFKPVLLYSQCRQQQVLVILISVFASGLTVLVLGKHKQLRHDHLQYKSEYINNSPLYSSSATSTHDA